MIWLLILNLNKNSIWFISIEKKCKFVLILFQKEEAMETIKTIYLGELRTKSIHMQSGCELLTDAPTDNHGKGEAFSPTDLLATSLGCCMLSVIGISAQLHNFNIEGAEVKATKIMTSNPRKVGEIIIDMYFPPNNYSEKEKKIIDQAVKTCPVTLSLHPDVKQTITLHY